MNNNSSIVSSSLQSNTATIYNTNKLPPVIVNRKSTSKCFLCKKKTGLATTYQCRFVTWKTSFFSFIHCMSYFRCGSSFCSEHRYPEAHACAFDYKAEGKRLIERNNPLITAPKLPKIWSYFSILNHSYMCVCVSISSSLFVFFLYLFNLNALSSSISFFFFFLASVRTVEFSSYWTVSFEDQIYLHIFLYKKKIIIITEKNPTTYLLFRFLLPVLFLSSVLD
jgi:AN1-type zinc finger and ubiquitin domain-containing protein 1